MNRIPRSTQEVLMSDEKPFSHERLVAWQIAREAAGAVVALQDDQVGDRWLAAEFIRLERRTGALITGLIKYQLRRR